MKFKKYIEKFNPDEIIKLNSEGKNIKEIAEIIDIPAKRLAEMIKGFNLNIKKGSNSKINETFFDKIDSEEKAYLLGFFIADGCMIKEEKRNNSYSYRFSINNSIDDIDVVLLFKKFICPNKEIKISSNQNGVKHHRKDQVILRWTSKYMFETLENYNIHPRKTFDNTFDIPDIIPDNLIRHFIRGFFDGDGHKGATDISFVLNSLKFGNRIKKFFDNFETREYTIQGKTCEYYRLYITGGKELLNWTNNQFYNNANYYLKRKYISFNSEVSIETKESITPQSVETEPLN